MIRVDQENYNKALEAVANLEHQQWVELMLHLRDNWDNPEKQQIWARQMETHYTNLTEDEKESDRYFAKKVLDKLGIVIVQ